MVKLQMALAISIASFGGPEVLQNITYEPLPPLADEVQVEHGAIEVNYIDVYHRRGTYSLNADPKIPGVSAVGRVVKLGADVTEFAVGDRVCYATSSKASAYCGVANVKQDILLKLQSDLSDTLIAANLLKGITAHMLACHVYVVRPGIAVLVHAAAGGVGRILAQWCNFLGAYVIGTVGSDDKKSVAMQNGCHLVINYSTENVVAKVREITENIGVHVVYDGVGAATFDASINCLMDVGMMVSYGGSSGFISNINVEKIASKSLFFTRPSVYNYAAHRKELMIAFEAFLAKINGGVIQLSKPLVFELTEAAKAHGLLESRKNTTSLVLVP
jgi:NADPH2:quinone reductase